MLELEPIIVEIEENNLHLNLNGRNEYSLADYYGKKKKAYDVVKTEFEK